MDPPLNAAVRRVRRIISGEKHRVVYGFTDDVMDDFNWRMMENAYIRDLKTIAFAYIDRYPEEAINESL